MDESTLLWTIPAVVLRVDARFRRARPLSDLAVQLVGGTQEFDLESRLPGLGELLARNDSGILYESPARDSPWVFSLSPSEPGFVAVGVSASRHREERRRSQALNEASLRLAAERSEENLLHQIIETARELTHARYGALGVFGSDRRLRRFVVSGLTPEEQEPIGPLPVGLGLLGVLRFADSPIRVADLTKDPLSHGFPPNHPPMHSFLGMPLISKGRNVGNIYLTEKVGAPEFTDEDEEIVVGLGTHAALAIENALLLTQLQEVAVTEERERIRRDLHDSIIQSVYGLGLHMELIAEQVDEQPRKAIESGIDSLNQIIEDLRAFISGLHPAVLSLGTFEQGFEAILSEASLGGLSIQSNITPGATAGLDAGARVHLLQFIREALSNVRKHAHASTVSVDLTVEGDRGRLRVVDNGRGFEASAKTRPGAQGLSNMAARAEALCGTFDVLSEPGRGTTVELYYSLNAGAN